MKNYFSLLLIFVALPSLTLVYYYFDYGYDVDRVFLSISTFLFSIFTGFFISRQAGRFNRVRETVTKFDGLMTSVYRASAHINQECQKAVAKILKKHYAKVMETGRWDINFVEKSTTLTDIHRAIEENVDDKEVTKLTNQALGSIIKNLSTAQGARKQMIALQKERVPFDQWVLIVFFSCILIGTVSAMSSVGLVFISLLKASFVISVFSVMFILYKLNNLAYTEKIMGVDSANDLLDIIKGSK